jgi:tRNA G18 (ribose-2'-O)-methylase SpoU
MSLSQDEKENILDRDVSQSVTVHLFIYLDMPIPFIRIYCHFAILCLFSMNYFKMSSTTAMMLFHQTHKQQNIYRRQKQQFSFLTLCNHPGRRCFRSSSSSSSLKNDYSQNIDAQNSQFNQRFSLDIISSTKSTTVKYFQSLLTKRKKRMELFQTVVEGPRIILDLLENGKTCMLVRKVIVSTDKPEWIDQLVSHQQKCRLNSRNRHHADDETVGQPSMDTTFHLVLGTPEVLTSISDTTTPQGIVALVDIPSSPSLPRSLLLLPTTSLDDSFPQMHLILDGVSDPGNVGTLLRSSLAIGAAGIWLLPGCADVWSPKTLRSAMGTTFQLPFVQQTGISSWQDIQKELQNSISICQNQESEKSSKSTIPIIYAASMEDVSNADSIVSIPYYDVSWKDSKSTVVALIIGSEGNGLSESIRREISCGNIRPIHVPMEAGIESLNAAVCGSVILFDFARQRRLKYRLTDPNLSNQ